MSTQGFRIISVCAIVALVPAGSLSAAETPQVSTGQYLEEKVEELNVTEEGMRVAMRLLWEGYSGVLADSGDKTDTEHNTHSKRAGVLFSVANPAADARYGAGFADVNEVIRFVDGDPVASDDLAKDRVTQLVWASRFVTLSHSLTKGKDGIWRLQDSFHDVISHPRPTEPPALEERAFERLLELAAEEVQDKSSSVPTHISDPKEAARYFPRYQAIVLLKALFSMNVVRQPPASTGEADRTSSHK